MFKKASKIIYKYDYILIFFSFFIFFCLTINQQKLEFYSLQNAVVENLVQQHTWGFIGDKVYDGMFYNTLTTTTQLKFPGDAFPYQGKWYPAKSYGAHYVAAIFYFLIYIIGLRFSQNYQLVSSLLLASTSFLLTSSAITLCYLLAKKITGSIPKSILLSFCLAFGSLLTGSINIRNEETFGYWLLLIIYLSTYFKINQKYKIWIWQLSGLYYVIFSLPIAALFSFLIVYKIVTQNIKIKLSNFVLLNLISIALIYFHNWLIWKQWIFSVYTLASKAVPGFNYTFFHFTPQNFIAKLNFYLLNQNTSMLLKYPLIILGIIGIFISPQKWQEKGIVLLTLLAFLGYILNIAEDGWVGYGAGRYALGLFPITYIYLIYIIKKFNPVLWLGLYFTSIVSIFNGLFYYFSPVGHFSSKNFEQFKNLPFQSNIFWFTGFILITLLFVIIFINNKQYAKK